MGINNENGLPGYVRAKSKNHIADSDLWIAPILITRGLLLFSQKMPCCTSYLKGLSAFLVLALWLQVHYWSTFMMYISMGQQSGDTLAVFMAFITTAAVILWIVLICHMVGPPKKEERSGAKECYVTTISIIVGAWALAIIILSPMAGHYCREKNDLEGRTVLSNVSLPVLNAQFGGSLINSGVVSFDPSFINLDVWGRSSTFTVFYISRQLFFATNTQEVVVHNDGLVWAQSISGFSDKDASSVLDAFSNMKYLHPELNFSALIQGISGTDYASDLAGDTEDCTNSHWAMVIIFGVAPVVLLLAHIFTPTIDDNSGETTPMRYGGSGRG